MAVRCVSVPWGFLASQGTESWLTMELSCCPLTEWNMRGGTFVLGGQPEQIGKGHRDKGHPPGEPRQARGSYTELLSETDAIPLLPRGCGMV